MIAACLVTGLAAAPSAMAADGSKSTSVTAKAAKITPEQLRRRVVKTERSIRGTRTAIATLLALSKSNKTGVDFLIGAAPALVNGLTALRDGSLQLKAGLETVGAGLLALKAGTEAGFASVKTSLTSTEYGFGQVLVLTPGPTAQAGSFVETPDIPDAVQQAQTEQQFLAQHSGDLAVAYGVRSGESDGTGAANPAAYCKVTVTNEAGATQTTAGNATFGGLPFQPVNTKSALTSTDPLNAGFPFGLKTSGADADQTTTFISTVPVTAGDTYTVGLSCVDTSASSTDPSA